MNIYHICLLSETNQFEIRMTEAIITFDDDCEPNNINIHLSI